MPTFPIAWKMYQRDRTYNDKNRYIWSEVLCPKWIMICVCSQNKPYVPDLIEIHRRCVTGEFLISGTLDLYGEDKNQCIAKKNFLQLLESGCSFSRMELIHSYNSAKSPQMFLMEGDVTISETPIKSVIDFINMRDSKQSEYLSMFELSDDFGNLLESRILSDVNLRCRNEIVPAHKNILSIRSPVFSAMFQNKQMKEVLENEVKIIDIDIIALKVMLSYIYTGKTGPLTVSLASELLVAADKYQLQGLKTACCNYLKEFVSRNNAVKILVLGDMLAPDLKNIVMDFICSKCEEFSTLQKCKYWKVLEKTRSPLAVEVLNSVVKAQEQKLKINRKMSIST